MHESGKCKGSLSVVSDPQRPHGLQPYQAPPSMGFSRQEYWSGVPLPSPKEDLTPVNFVTETSPRPLAVKEKKKDNVSRLCCTNKSECQWTSQSISPYHQSTTCTVRRPSALPVATLAAVCGSAGWVSPSGALWLHPSKSKSSTGLLSFHLSHYRVGVWRNSH